MINKKNEVKKQIELSKKIMNLYDNNDAAHDLLSDENMSTKESMKELLTTMVHDGIGFGLCGSGDTMEVNRALVHLDELTNVNGDHILDDTIVCVDPNSDPYVPDSEELSAIYQDMQDAAQNN